MEANTLTYSTTHTTSPARHHVTTCRGNVQPRAGSN